MYAEFFGLRLLPFNNTPDPRFFFHTPDHEEALASLLYAAQGRKGCVLVTGEIGSGKTLLSRMLVARLPAGSKAAVITNSRLTGSELLRAIAREFGLTGNAGCTVSELSQQIEKFLLEQFASDHPAVVIVDEAQHLAPDAFEDVRMLGNLEADDAKLLQFLILGQPELQQTFRRPEMRQLSQRVFRSFHLRGLSRELTGGYIAHRLAVAGLAANERIFDEDAVELVYHHAQGIPRVINQICDNAMLAAYTESSRRVTRAFVEETISQMISSEAGTEEAGERPNSGPAIHHPVARPGLTQTADSLPSRPNPANVNTAAAMERERETAASQLAEIRQLVTTSREQAASMIAGLRRQVQQHVEAAQNEIKQTLDQTREAVLQLSREANEASAPIERTRKYVASSVQEGLSDLARFSGEVGTLQLEIQQRLSAAREELTNLVDQQKQQVERTAGEWFQSEKVSIRALREGMHEEIARVKEELRGLSQTPMQSASELRAAQHALQTQSLKQRAWMKDEIARVQKALSDQIDAGRKSVEQAQHLAEHAIGQAALAHHVPEDLPEKLRDRLAKILAAAKERLMQLRDDASGATKQMSLELTSLRNQARESLSSAAFAGGELRRQHEATMDETRSALSQILERVGQAKLEITQYLDHVRSETTAAIEQSRRASTEAASQAREQLRTEADSQHQRLSKLWIDVEKAATRIQSGSEKLHEQVQTTAASLLQNASQILDEAKATATKLTEKTESLLHDATQTGQGIHQQCRALLDGSIEENARVRDDVAQAREEILEAHAQARAALSNADAEHRAAVEKTEAMLKSADQARARAEEMLALPHQVLHETARRTAALTELMQKITTVLQALGTMGERARIQETALQSASTNAEQQIHSLKHHSQRVGQLVGIIRQLYGTLDAKVGRLRDRLTVADDLFRVMPRQIDVLRQVLAEGASEALPLAPAEPRVASPARSQTPVSPRTGRAPVKKVVVEKPSAVAKQAAKLAAGGQGSIAELARRNQKLNAWLRDVLEEAKKGEAQAAPPAPANRISAGSSTQKPVAIPT